ncbi:hypothetical protein Sste5346_004984 [Sporothrix stenoceras]|uniref:Uncharacterized protein n=1 Tax=Sporothrix stenoceras TaxID=5173 RepID=A0ABR3Z6T7_9PEZI
MGNFETYDVPPPYSTYCSAPSNQYQAPACYAPPPGPPPSLRMATPATPSYNSNNPYAGSAYAGSPYGSRQTYNAIPEEYRAMAEMTQQPQQAQQSHPNTQLPSPSSSQGDEQEVDEIAAHYRQYMQPAPSPSAGGFFSSSSPSPSTALTRLIMIPQAYPASVLHPPAPFLRAYPPALASREIGISPALFVAIVDALNLCLAPPPPLQALNLVGQGVGLVPHHIAQGVSAGLGVVAGVGVAATRITKQKRFLAKVNADVFGPRGLAMEVVKDEAALGGVGLSQSSLPKAVPSTQVAGPVAGGTGLNAATQTRLTQLAPYTSPLSFDVPPAAVPTSLMDRISARQTAARLAKDAKRDDKRMQKREEKMRKLGDRRSSSLSSDDDDSGSSYSDGPAAIHAQFDARRQVAEQQGDWKEVAKIEKKRAKEIEDFQKKQRKHGSKHGGGREDKHQRKYDKKMSKMDRKEHKQDEKGQKKMGKLLWIVIRPVSERVEEYKY